MTKKRPLDGVRVVVTRPREQAPTLIAALERGGASVVPLPLIRIEDPESWDALDGALRAAEAGRYEWVLFASVNAVDRVWSRMATPGLTAFGQGRVGAVGGATAAALTERGVSVDVVPQRSTGPDLAAAIGEGPGAVLFPRVEGGPRAVVEALESRGWDVDEVAAYRNVPEEPEPAALRRVRTGDVDVVTFTSASAVRAFARLVPPDVAASRRGSGPVIACIGPSTARAARREGFRVDVEAGEHTIPGLVHALERHFETTDDKGERPGPPAGVAR